MVFKDLYSSNNWYKKYRKGSVINEYRKTYMYRT